MCRPAAKPRCNIYQGKRYELAGLNVVASTPEQFAETLTGEMAKWKKLVEELGLKPE